MLKKFFATLRIAFKSCKHEAKFGLKVKNILRNIEPEQKNVLAKRKNMI